MIDPDPDKVTTRQDFCDFLEELRQSLRNGDAYWENVNLDDYFEALGAWLTDMAEYNLSKGQIEPSSLSWKDVAGMFHAAAVYE